MPLRPPPQSWFRTCSSSAKDSSSPFRGHLPLCSEPEATTELFFVITDWFAFTESYTHSTKCLWDSFTFLHLSMVPSFSLMSSIPLHGLHYTALTTPLLCWSLWIPTPQFFGYCEWNCCKCIQVIVWTYNFRILKSRIALRCFWKVKELWLTEIM